MTNRIKIIVI